MVAPRVSALVRIWSYCSRATKPPSTSLPVALLVDAGVVELRGVSGQVGLGRQDRGLVLGERGLRLQERGLELARVDGEEQGARRDLLPLREVHLRSPRR